MREIKFRTWDKVNKKMELAFDLSSNPKYWWDELKDFPLMQYTGLKDKNGKEIFEGDIVTCEFAFGDNVCEIVYDDNKAGFFVSQENREIADKVYDNLYWHFVGIEVIGNIYENPELLDK